MRTEQEGKSCLKEEADGVDGERGRQARKGWAQMWGGSVGWMEGEAAVITGLVVRLERSLFQRCHSALTQQNEIFSH